MSNWVLVTGASSGIGRATAVRLARQGARVIAGVRSSAVADELRAVLGPRSATVQFDVTDDGSIQLAAKEVAALTGGSGLHGLVNNAGIAVGGPIEYLEVDQWREQFEVNVFGQIAVTRAFLPAIRTGQGRIVFVGSNSGRISVAMMGPYCSSKHALEAVAESLRLELRAEHIPVVLIEPGAVRTPIWDKGRRAAAELEQTLPPQALVRYRDQIDAVHAGIDQQEKSGIDPDRVAAAVQKALTAARPSPRIQVGLDASLTAVLDRLLPDRLRPIAVATLSRP